MSEIVPTPTPPITPEITGAPVVKSDKGLYIVGALFVLGAISFFYWSKKKDKGQ